MTTTIDLDSDFPVRLCKAAHASPRAAEVGHRDGFCLACAEIYVAYNVTVLDPYDAPTAKEPPDMTPEKPWYEVSEDQRQVLEGLQPPTKSTSYEAVYTVRFTVDHEWPDYTPNPDRTLLRLDRAMRDVPGVDSVSNPVLHEVRR